MVLTIVVVLVIAAIAAVAVVLVRSRRPQRALGPIAQRLQDTAADGSSAVPPTGKERHGDHSHD